MRKLVYKFLGSCKFCGRFDFFVGFVAVAVGNVVAYGSVEDVNVLLNDADVFAKRFQGNVFYVYAVNENVAAGCVVEARQKVHESRFACSRRPDDCHVLTFFNV